MKTKLKTKLLNIYKKGFAAKTVAESVLPYSFAQNILWTNSILNMKNSFYLYMRGYYFDWTNIEDFDDGDDVFDERTYINELFKDWIEEEFGKVKNWNKINPKDYIGKTFHIGGQSGMYWFDPRTNELSDWVSIDGYTYYIPTSWEYTITFDQDIWEECGRLYINIGSTRDKQWDKVNKLTPEEKRALCVKEKE